MYSISIAFGVNSIALGDNSKAYGDNSKGYGDRIHPYKKDLIRGEKRFMQQDWMQYVVITSRFQCTNHKDKIFFPFPNHFHSIGETEPCRYGYNLPPDKYSHNTSFVILSTYQVEPAPLSVPRIPPCLYYPLLYKQDTARYRIPVVIQTKIQTFKERRKIIHRQLQINTEQSHLR